MDNEDLLQGQGLNLVVSRSDPAPPPPDPEKCMICQKDSKKCNKLYGGETGRKRVHDAALVKDDDVYKRLKILGPNFPFKYHSNECYKPYTDSRSMPASQEHCDADNSDVVQRPTRSSIPSRPGPSTSVYPKQVTCAICAKDRVQVRGKRVKDKFRICSDEKAVNFLNAMQSHKDDVYVRCADLSTPEDVYAADLYCHNSCFQRYVYDPSETPSGAQTTSNPKRELFAEVLRQLDPLINDGYGFTVAEIRDVMASLSAEDDVEIYNRDVKGFLIEHYGDRIRFCPSHKVNESEMFFSSDISIEDITAKLRDMDVVRSCGKILREAFQKVDFNISDKFCDGHELKKSWENTQMPEQLLTFFASLFGINRSRLLKIEMVNMMFGDDMANDDSDVDDGGDDGEGTQDIDWAVHNQHNQLHCLFQIMYYQMFHGARKTPLHVSFGHFQYGKSRSREILTVANHIGVSTSYNDVKRSRRLLAAYAFERSLGEQVPIPSTFTADSFTTGAMDNADFSDKSSISGMESDHTTMQVLYQEATSTPTSKPKVSEMTLKKRLVCLPDTLPCQEVPHHPKPTVRPSLPPNFKVAEETSTTNVSNIASALDMANKVEFLISFIRCGLPKDVTESGIIPTWSGCHALISTTTAPLMRVGFLPMIPSPVTDYATVRKALQNFQNVLCQLNPSQSAIPVFCDEGVYHTVADILMAEPITFADVHGMMGMFHWVKVLLKCAGRYLRGSGFEDGLIESKIFGKLSLNTVLEGTHYVRSFQGITLISDVITSLIWEGFWTWLKQGERELEVDDDIMICSKELRAALCNKKRSKSVEKFNELLVKADHFQEMFNTFMEECQSRSELCLYWVNFLTIVKTIKHIISSDREGNFKLHLASVDASLPIFRESDCLNYLRYGSYYLESTKLLESSHPHVFQQFLSGYFVVKVGPGSFNAVAPDMKLEQSIQRASKEKGGIVGQTKNLPIVVEWQLIFHEILLISNNLRDMTHTTMAHMESAKVHHDLVGKRAENLNRNVERLLDFVCNRGNPFVIQTPRVKLHNFVTKQLAEDEVAVRLLKALSNGKRCYLEFRSERLLKKTKKLSATISKRNLPRLDFRSSSETPASTVTVSQKELAAAQRDIDIVKERGMSMESVYSHDILSSSILFEGDLASKPEKSKLMVEIEKHLTQNDTVLPRGDAAVVLDFMSKIRTCPNLSSFGTFADAMKWVLSAGQSKCTRTSLHVVFDSYLETSIKGGERIRRAAGIGIVDMAIVGPEVPIPQQMDKFWPSPQNKTKLQGLARVLAPQQGFQHPIILSGCVVDDEVTPAQLIQKETQDQETSPPTPIDTLTNSIEEADDRLVLHCAWEVSNGCKRLLVISNDTDTVMRLLHFVPDWLHNGLHELWVEFGSGERRRHLPLHTLAQRLGYSLCRVLVKVHVLTGDDAVSKIGTKYAAITFEPEKYLNDFAEADNLSEESVKTVEEYLVHVWNGAGRKTSSQTFDQLRFEEHCKSATPKALAQLPPTSSVIRAHIQRSLFIVYNVVNLLNEHAPVLDPTDYGWFCDGDTILPVKALKPLPDEMLCLCNCGGKCDGGRCKCAKAGLVYVAFCHKSGKSECQNIEL